MSSVLSVFKSSGIYLYNSNTEFQTIQSDTKRKTLVSKKMKNCTETKADKEKCDKRADMQVILVNAFNCRFQLWNTAMRSLVILCRRQLFAFMGIIFP